jgi:predicted metal-dependent hydrolase|uniref:WLM domain-containing protein n=1 Tax=viral metagenome TaxID=1070528 RepID=A0A6C0BFT3_9ZZZZ
MITFLDYFVLFIGIIILFLYIKSYYGEVEYVKSKKDNQYYLVRKLPDKENAANLLSQLGDELDKLVKHMMAKYPDNKDVKRLYANFNKNNISEGSPDSSYTSYSVNKGEKIVLCVRQKDEKNSFVDKNVLMYVSVHELAHLMTEEIGHTTTFWTNFKFLLTEAVSIGIYKKVDYAKSPAPFCGIKISSSII